jgi:hypothetical protein
LFTKKKASTGDSCEKCFGCEFGFGRFDVPQKIKTLAPHHSKYSLDGIGRARRRRRTSAPLEQIHESLGCHINASSAEKVAEVMQADSGHQQQA